MAVVRLKCSFLVHLTRLSQLVRACFGGGESVHRLGDRAALRCMSVIVNAAGQPVGAVRTHGQTQNPKPKTLRLQPESPDFARAQITFLLLGVENIGIQVGAHDAACGLFQDNSKLHPPTPFVCV